MKVNIRRFLLFFCRFILYLTSFFLIFSYVTQKNFFSKKTNVKAYNAYFKVTNFTELREALEKECEGTVVLENDIYVLKTIFVKGNKKLKGNGYALRRSDEKKGFFGGNMLAVRKGRLYLENLLISGALEKKYVTYGRIITITNNGYLEIGKDVVLQENKVHNKTMDGGGGIYISNGKVVMNSGQIKDNQTSCPGGAVYICKNGCFVMNGGIIFDNKSVGVGVVENFDGRGGAIYNKGRFVMNGGTISNNIAKSYEYCGKYYGGAGGGVFSVGTLLIKGGRLYNNTGTLIGGGIYSVNAKAFSRMGGSIKDNKAKCFKNIYPSLSKEVTKKKKKREINPAKPDKKSGYKNSKHIKSKKNDSPRIITKCEKIYLYKGEYYTDKKLMSVVKAVDYDGKNITDKLRVDKISGNKKGYIFFSVVNDKKSKACHKLPYKVLDNMAPRVKTANRFLFLDEIKDYDKSAWNKEVMNSISVSDDVDSQSILKKNAKLTFELNASKKSLLSNEEGEYFVSVTVKDQIGNRFYMKENEEKRYGKGEMTKVYVKVNVVRGNCNTSNMHLGFVDFSKKSVAKQSVLVYTASEVERLKKEILKGVEDAGE